MDWSELNFNEICRCCKRLESGMHSIFDGSADTSYTSVKEMLNSIASFHVEKNDGLPSLVCTSCLSKIRDAYIFLQQLILIDAELWLTLASRKQVNTLLQDSLSETKPCISTEAVKNESTSTFFPAGTIFFENSEGNDSEDMEQSSTVEDLKTVLNVYQNNTNSVEPVVVPIPENEAANKLQMEWEEWEEWNFGTPKFSCQVCNKVFKTASRLESHKIIYCVSSVPLVPSLPATGNRQKYYSDSEDMGKSNSLLTDNDNINESTNQDTAQDFYEETDAEIEEEICPKEQETNTSNLAAIEKNHQEYYSESRDMRKSNSLLSDNDDDVDAIMKDSTNLDTAQDFYEETDAEIEEENCPKERESTSNLGAKEIDHQEYYSKSEHKGKSISLLSNAQEFYEETDDGENCPKQAESSSNLASVAGILMYKCKLCADYSPHIHGLKKHLQRHCSVKPFTCSKCIRTFSYKQTMIRHWKKCNGENFACDFCNRRNFDSEINLQIHNQMFHEGRTSRPSVQMIPMSISDLRNSSEIDKYYTKEVWPTSRVMPSSLAAALNLLRCNLCKFTTEYMVHLKRHLKTHLTPFKCSKCKDTFAERDNLVRHSQNCNDTISKKAPGERQSKELIGEPSILQDLEDPQKMKKYYTILRGCDQIV